MRTKTPLNKYKFNGVWCGRQLTSQRPLMISMPLAEALPVEESYNGFLLDAQIYAKAEPLILLWLFVSLVLVLFFNAAWQLKGCFPIDKFSDSAYWPPQLAQRGSASPPRIFHLFPFVGSALSYSISPVRFISSCHRAVGVLDLLVLWPSS